jgi:hypothetical protein
LVGEPDGFGDVTGQQQALDRLQQPPVALEPVPGQPSGRGKALGGSRPPSRADLAASVVGDFPGKLWLGAGRGQDPVLQRGRRVGGERGRPVVQGGAARRPEGLVDRGADQRVRERDGHARPSGPVLE